MDWDALSDLRLIAEDVRLSMPDLADRLHRDTQAILDCIGPIAVAQIATVLDVSRPTVYGLVEDGYLGAVIVGNHKAVDPTSLVDVLPVVREWQANGAMGGLRRHLHAWHDGELLAARERRRYRDLIKAGYDPDEWPDDTPATFPAPSVRAGG